MLIDLPDSTQEIAKNYITVIYEDKETKVSWYADTSIEDARFAIICACDSLVDSEFEVLDVGAKVVDLNTIKSIKNGTIFFLRKKNTNKPTSILLDGRRKLFVQIEPLRHVEAQVALKYMLIGSNLLKHTKQGFPHIRLFQISQDLKRILWYTKSKKINEATVPINSIVELAIGQASENFIRYPLKMIEDFSFSIYYKNSDNKTETLDITCKDEREFDLWVIGVKALYAHFNNKIINKNDLLSHSKSYNEQVNKGNIGSATKFLFYKDNSNNNNPNNTGKSLESYVISRKLSQFEIVKLFLKLSYKIRELRDDVENLSHQEESYSTGKKEEGYDMIFAEEAIVDDLDTQKSQMINLYKQCERNMALLLEEFLWFAREQKLTSYANLDEDDMDEFPKSVLELENHSQTHLRNHDKSSFNPDKINPEFFLRETDIKLWKIEIDLENVGDIINRFKTSGNSGIVEALKGLFKFLK